MIDDVSKLLDLAGGDIKNTPNKPKKDDLEINGFIAYYDIKKGSMPIAKPLVYDYYLQWSKNPLTAKRFYIKMNKIFGTQFYNGTKCWYLDPTCFKLPSFYSMSKDSRFFEVKKSKVLEKYKGVTETHGYFIARIKTEENTHYIGRYKTAKEAARAYDLESYRHYGNDAVLNFPQDVDKYEEKIKKET